MHFMDPRPTVQFSSVNEAIPEVSLHFSWFEKLPLWLLCDIEGARGDLFPY